eukprot:CAMPEP_0201530366 /NCGR_PEP_ID=MMETSP0161_2-20130828/44454_1 /ASSEMBLY_ACC=CAM_ASM_000251 /TAXON_ID=180227 /ORGANISM="Neoparamoeba aestuarina, Strain SoJaBio B1-5/56/2" /LENGTH=406 /DNA_ID=CAMNT_0047932687 /DNA_START=92 /DNA_END=1308 /DNA_ORIENTATION=-
MALFGCSRACLRNAPHHFLFPSSSLQLQSASLPPTTTTSITASLLQQRRNFLSLSTPHTARLAPEAIKAKATTASPVAIVKTATVGIPYALLKSGDEFVKIDAGKATLAELADQAGAKLRDLRNMKPSIPIRSSLIVVRDKSILVIVDPMKVIIYHDRIQFFHTEHPAVRSYLRDFFVARMAKTKAQNFELKALECLLITAVRQMDRELESMTTTTKELVQTLQSAKQTTHDLQRLLDCTQQINSYHAKIQQLCNEMGKVLTSDEDMSKMYLTDIAEGRSRVESDHTEVELLFETFHHAASELEQRATSLKTDISLMQQFLEVHFDSQRNRLMRFNIALSAATLSVSLGSLGASMFGMNLINHLEDHPTAFLMVVSCLGGVGVTSLLGTWGLYKRTKERAVHIRLP